MYRRHPMGTKDVALAVAIFMVVQALFSGLSLGARADTLAFPPGILCIGAESAAADPGGSADRTHLVDCCTLGCPMLGGLPLPQPAAVQAAPALTGHAVPLALTAHLPGRFELSPLRSRAPPAA